MITLSNTDVKNKWNYTSTSPHAQINRHDDTVIPLPCGRLKAVVFFFGRVTFAFQTEPTTETASLMWSAIIALNWFSKKKKADQKLIS